LPYFNVNYPFRELALEEIKKNSKVYMTKKASELAENIYPKYFKIEGKFGIRA
jgi:hypothetical protein